MRNLVIIAALLFGMNVAAQEGKKENYEPTRSLIELHRYFGKQIDSTRVSVYEVQGQKHIREVWFLNTGQVFLFEDSEFKGALSDKTVEELIKEKVI